MVVEIRNSVTAIIGFNVRILRTGGGGILGERFYQYDPTHHSGDTTRGSIRYIDQRD